MADRLPRVLVGVLWNGVRGRINQHEAKLVNTVGPYKMADILQITKKCFRETLFVFLIEICTKFVAKGPMNMFVHLIT